MSVERVRCYIDGFNLYHAIQDLRKPHLKWVDLMALGEVFLMRRSQRLDAVFYFSAYAEWWPERAKRHRAYVAALAARGVHCIMGHFKKKDRSCPRCHHSWTGHEEKETDVNIALAMLNHAYKNEFDHAFLFSRDSDIAPAVRMVRAEFPRKKVTIVAPPNKGHSTELIAAATAKAKLREDHISRCLLPKEVYDAGGNIVAIRPVEYDPPI